MMKMITMHFFYCGLIFGFATNTFCQDQNVEELKKTYQDWIKAWNERNVEAIGEISWPNYGFGRDVPFLREPATNKSSYIRGLESYMKMMEDISYKDHFSSFKIIDDVGFVDGFYEQTTQQRAGPSRTLYGRQSLVFLKRDNKWVLIHYHRSSLPNEFIR